MNILGKMEKENQNSPENSGNENIFQKVSEVKWLFLDIGGVLLTNGWDHVARKKAIDLFGLDQAETEERHHLTFDTYEEGKLSLEQYLQRVVFYDERSFSQEDFREFMFAQSLPFNDMISLVQELKARYTLKIAVISNEGRELTKYRINQFGLDKFVDFFISSSFVHMRKPDEDLFHLALDIAHISPEQVIYIDDRRMFVQVAESIGIHGIHHKSFETTRKILEEKGLKIIK
jgi:putative hydrolase of the HAD superfamily